MGERVWFDRDQVRAVVSQIRLRVPPGTHRGVNDDGDHAWAFAETSVDLPALVQAALSPDGG